MGAAAAIILRKEREIVELYRRAGATSPAAARTPDEFGIHDRFPFHSLVRRAVLRDAGGGQYYLDEPRWERLRSIRRRAVSALILVMIIVVALLIASGVIDVKLGLPRLQ